MTIVSAEYIKQEALRSGFAACGIVPATTVGSEAAFLDAWLQSGSHAGMSYMANYRDVRLDPQKLVEGAKSIISVALNYYPSQKRSDGEPYIAYYAYGKDYHQVLKEKLYALWQLILSALQETEGAEARVFTDSAPILERYWAWRAGLGWIGKNTNLIIPHKGSFFFLGEIVTTLEFDTYDKPISSHCGTCTRCLDACPTQALHRPYCLDANRCFSYQTIENRGEIPADLAKRLGNRLYGCDTCQLVCPWNRFATPTQEPAFHPSKELLQLKNEDLDEFSREDYTRIFSGSAVKRAKYEGLSRTIQCLKENDKKEDNLDSKKRNDDSCGKNL